MKKNNIIINDLPNSVNIAVTENYNLVEFYCQDKTKKNLIGNIYIGTVENILPGIQAAFIDIGLEKNVFLHSDNIIANENFYTDLSPNALSLKDTYSNKKINKLIKKNQKLLVQVTKESYADKGPQVSTKITIPGFYLVLLPYVNHIGISNKITNTDEEKRLKSIIETNRPNDYGYIIRTEAENCDKTKMIEEIKFLNDTWDKIIDKFNSIKKEKNNCMVYNDNFISRLIHNIYSSETHQIVADSKERYEELKENLTYINNNKIKFYQECQPIFFKYGIENNIKNIFKNKIWLKCGGNIVIEKTQALTSIDINTGKYINENDSDKTAFKTNSEALKEIAYQIRLRNISGLIIIDLIDMKNENYKTKLFDLISDLLTNDRIKTYIAPITEYGVLQLTRQRVYKSLAELMYRKCKNCNGYGIVMHENFVRLEIEQKLFELNKIFSYKHFILKTSPELYEFLVNNSINTFFKKYIKYELTLEKDDALTNNKYEILEN